MATSRRGPSRPARTARLTVPPPPSGINWPVIIMVVLLVLGFAATFAMIQVIFSPDTLGPLTPAP